jgi:protein arginine kinase activator
MSDLPERHLECSECKKPIVVCYTEIVGKMIYRLGMCADCPILRQKLHGQASAGQQLTTGEAAAAGLACGGCGTTADEVRMGVLLGCSLCYEVFEDLIIQELQLSNRLAQKVSGLKKIAPLHLGRLPGQSGEMNPAMKLVALHQALNETLSREDYEQAAWLRDQIKALTDGKKNE